MTYPSFPSIFPTFGLSKTSAPNIKTVQFGDGYIQRLTFGLNQNAKTWNPVWENISEAQSDEIELFLDARAANNGQAFTWAAPNEPSTSTAWATGASYSVGDIRKPTTNNETGFYYEVTAVSGSSPYTSGSSEPSWPLKIGTTVTDNEVTWTTVKGSSLYICSSWDKQINYAGYATINATFQEVFEP